MMDYTQIQKIVERLTVAHNPAIARIRADFFQREFEWLRRRIVNKRVLVAGSGLGHDVFALAPTNTYVVGLELHGKLIAEAMLSTLELGLANVSFIEADMRDLSHLDFFDVAILNMGTISDFEPMSVRQQVIAELLTHVGVLYLDFYPPTNIDQVMVRVQMYREEAWVNVHPEGDAIVSDDGLYSKWLSRDELGKIARNIGATVTFHRLCGFADMAEFRRK